MKRKWFLSAAATVLTLLLTGCTPLKMDAPTLMKPPKTTAEKQEIYQVLEEKAGAQMTLRYPKAGEYRSAIIMKDVTGDGNEEALAFYTKGDESFTFLSVISEVGGVWQEIANFQSPAVQIDRVCFGDFSGNGVTDFAVGWGSSAAGTAELSLYTSAEGTVKEISTKEFYSELAVLELHAIAKVFGILNGNVNLMDTVALDPEVTKYNKVTVAKIDANHTGILLDSATSARVFQTEILYWEKSGASLRNPLYFSGEKNYTLRAAAIASQDINGDGIAEIPITHGLPGEFTEDAPDTAYAVNWHRYDMSTNTFTNLLSTVVNSRDGYMMILPEAWRDNITTEQNAEQASLSFYQWRRAADATESGSRGELLLRIYVMTQEQWNAQAETTQLHKLKQHSNIVFAAELPQTQSELGLTLQETEQYFKIFTQG